MPCLGYEQIHCLDPTVQDASDLTIPSGTYHAELQATIDGDINYTLDGSTVPGASSGMVFPANGIPKQVNITDLKNIKFVKSGAGTHLNIHYFR